MMKVKCTTNQSMKFHYHIDRGAENHNKRDVVGTGNEWNGTVIIMAILIIYQNRGIWVLQANNEINQ